MIMDIHVYVEVDENQIILSDGKPSPPQVVMNEIRSNLESLNYVETVDVWDMTANYERADDV